MSSVVRRGYIPKDEVEFGSLWTERLKHAAEDLYYLLNRGYDIKSSSNFIGNHFMLTERQRLAITRIVSSDLQLKSRKVKELMLDNIKDTFYIDGFNTIITLEVALSKSLVLRGMDGCLRDLAGLRGNYRIVDKTEQAVSFILKMLDDLNVRQAVIYLDKPVSNSGRLKTLVYEMSQLYNVIITVEVITDVDRTLMKLEGVISSDAVILDNCISWFNLNQNIIDKYNLEVWIYEIESKTE